MNRCSKTGLTDQDFRTILDVLNMYDPNDVIEVVPQMATPEFMQQVQSAFKAVLAHVNRTKYGSDLGAADGLDAEDHAEADLQRFREDRVKEIEALAYQQYIHSLS